MLFRGFLRTKLVKEITRFWLKLMLIYCTESCENLTNRYPSPFRNKTIIPPKHNLLLLHSQDRKNLRKIILSFLPPQPLTSSFHIVQGVMLWNSIVTLTFIISEWPLAQWYLERIQKSHFASHFVENYELFCVFFV